MEIKEGDWRYGAMPPLSVGSHQSIKEGVCLLEAVSIEAGEPMSAEPITACPVIADLARSFNDAIPNSDDRNRLLLPLKPKLIGSKSTFMVERARRKMCRDWLVRVAGPAWLYMIGFRGAAEALEAISLDDINTRAAGLAVEQIKLYALYTLWERRFVIDPTAGAAIPLWTGALSVAGAARGLDRKLTETVDLIRIVSAAISGASEDQAATFDDPITAFIEKRQAATVALIEKLLSIRPDEDDGGGAGVVDPPRYRFS